jgi:Phage tail tube protein
MTLDMAVNGFLTASLDLDSKDEDSSQTIGTVAYPASPENFSFVNTVVKINSVEQKFLRSLKITIAKPTDGGRFPLGSALRNQPLTNAFSSIKLDIQGEYNNNTLYKFFEKAEAKTVEVTFTAGSVEATALELKLLFPMCRFEGDSPNIADLGPLMQSLPLMVEDNTSEAPCTATYVSLEKDVT